MSHATKQHSEKYVQWRNSDCFGNDFSPGQTGLMFFVIPERIGLRAAYGEALSGCFIKAAGILNRLRSEIKTPAGDSEVLDEI